MFQALIRILDRMIRQTTNEDSYYFKDRIINELNDWKKEQQRLHMANKQSFNLAQMEQTNQKHLREMQALKEQMRTEAEELRIEAERAAERARCNQNRANEVASRASSSATNAHISAMGAQFAQSTTVGK